jgi:hypothetical protein
MLPLDHTQQLSVDTPASHPEVGSPAHSHHMLPAAEGVVPVVEEGHMLHNLHIHHSLPDEEHIPGSIVVAELVELAAVEGAAAMSVVAAAGHNQFVDHKKQHPTVPGH